MAIVNVAILIYNIATMSGKDKLLIKFINNPQSFRYKEIELILLRNGFQLIEAKGSHKKFKHHSMAKGLIIPVHNNDCKIFYKKYVKKILKSLHHTE